MKESLTALEYYVVTSFNSAHHIEYWTRGCRQNLGLIMQQSQDDVYTQSDSARPAIS